MSGRELQNVIQPVGAVWLGRGNFRLLQRLFVEIEPVLVVNGLPAVNTEVVAYARESLVIGPT